MPIFDCGSCRKRIKVPDSYAGKQVRCPGCSSAQRVPDAVNAAALDAFESLEAKGAPTARAVREILIGCGPCGKSIRLKEHQMGGTAPCPGCGTLLMVDAFKLPKPGKRGGGLVDMSHLELDAADPLLGGRGFPDEAGAPVQMADSHGDGSVSGYALSGYEDPTSLGGGAGDSQTQLRELRELNDLKHSGAISNAEYKERKKDIYAGKTLAIQAMSRSTDGTSSPSGRPVVGREQALLPAPVKALAAVLVLGVGGYVLWDNLLSPGSGGSTPPPAATTNAAPLVTAVQVEPESEPVVLDPPEMVETPVVVAVAEEVAPPEAPVQAAPEPVIEEVPAEPEPEPEGEWLVTEWPIRNATQTSPDRNLPLGKACAYVMRLETRNGNAMAGVAVGPEAESMDDPAYAAFRDAQFAIILQSAEARDMLKALNIKQTEKPVRVGRQVVDRLTVEHKTERSAQAAVLTLVQDGRAIAYWFEGKKLAYRPFVAAVGTAELMSELQIRKLQEEEAARRALF